MNDKARTDAEHMTPSTQARIALGAASGLALSARVLLHGVDGTDPHVRASLMGAGLVFALLTVVSATMIVRVLMATDPPKAASATALGAMLLLGIGLYSIVDAVLG